MTWDASLAIFLALFLISVGLFAGLFTNTVRRTAT